MGRRLLVDCARRDQLVVVLGLALAVSAGAVEPDGRKSTPSSGLPTVTSERLHMLMTIGTHRFHLALEDNPTARAFAQMLPATFGMTELNGNEKYATLPRKLPTNATRADTIRSGDVMLYGSDTLVVFYKTFQSSYSYTRIGRVEPSDALAEAFGTGNQAVTFSVR
jgi:hypothetical protein